MHCYSIGTICLRDFFTCLPAACLLASVSFFVFEYYVPCAYLFINWCLCTRVWTVSGKNWKSNFMNNQKKKIEEKYFREALYRKKCSCYCIWCDWCECVVCIENFDSSQHMTETCFIQCTWGSEFGLIFSISSRASCRIQFSLYTAIWIAN